MARQITGLKENTQFAGSITHDLTIGGLTPAEADQLLRDIAKALAPVLTAYAKKSLQYRERRLLECERGHKFWSDENYCVHCNLYNKGKTAREYLKQTKGGE